MNASQQHEYTTPQDGQTQDRSATGAPGSAPSGTLLMPAPASTRRRTRQGLAPARIDLVERFDTGKLYLRAFIDGHFFWQPASGAGDSIPDSGTWMTGRAFHDVYWINHGAYRRRAGSYHPAERWGAARRAG